MEETNSNPATRIRELARECYERACAHFAAGSGRDGTHVRQLAGEMLAKQIRRDTAMLVALVEPLIEQAANARIASAIGAHRKNAAASVERNGFARESGLARAMSLMDWPIWGGDKKLGDATAAEVEQSGKNYLAQATTGLQNGFWQLLVAAAARKAGATPRMHIRSVLTQAQLKDLWVKAELRARGAAHNGARP